MNEIIPEFWLLTVFLDRSLITEFTFQLAIPFFTTYVGMETFFDKHLLRPLEWGFIILTYH